MMKNIERDKKEERKKTIQIKIIKNEDVRKDARDNRSKTAQGYKRKRRLEHKL